MRLSLFLACALAGTGAPLAAETDLTALTKTERAAFSSEIRALLLDDPRIVSRALAGPTPYAAAIDSDLARIDAHADTLFPGGAAVAIFTVPDCAPCDRALDELRALSAELGVTFTRLDGRENRALTRALDLDEMPSYVFPEMMVRGHVPPIVLRRYLTR